MAGFVGADPDALDGLAHRMQSAAEQLTSIQTTVTASLHSASWAGNDAASFQDLWTTRLAGFVTASANVLRECAQRLQAQATQQRTASSVGGAGSAVAIGAAVGSAAAAGIAALAGANGSSATGEAAALHARDVANRAAALRALQQAEAAGDTKQVALLKGLLQSLDAPNRTLLVFDPQHDQYAVGIGDIAAADHVAIMVPGFSGDADKDMIEGWIPDSNHIYDASAASDPASAVIMWKGYQDPSGADVTSMDDAKQGASSLTSFVNGLGLQSDQSLTIVAHSYGTVVTGLALADDGLRPTNVVALGSPGMGIDNIGQLHLAPNQFYDESNDGDVVTDFGYFGTDPSSPTFGGIRMDTGIHDLVVPNFGPHSAYFDAGSQSINNIAGIVTDNQSLVHVQQASLGDWTAEGVRTGLNPAQPILDQAAREYDGPLSTPFQIAVHADDAVTNVVAAGTGKVIDTAAEAGGAVVHIFSTLF
jgi:uncharacterized protein YukE